VLGSVELVKQIAECLNRTPRTIHKVIVVYRDFGQEKLSPRSGKPKIYIVDHGLKR
jgi:hypothetical protein